MNGLADMALLYLTVCMFAGEGNIDSDFADMHMQGFTELLQALSANERSALSDAARRTVVFMNQPPDQYGYKPVVNESEKNFLESLASGEIFKHWG
jgi:hypothetical protein